MSFVDTKESEQRNILNRLYQTSPDQNALDPGFFTGGDLLEIPKGAALALNKSALLLADTFTPSLLTPARKLDELLGGPYVENYLLDEQKRLRNNMKALRPDPTNTGTVGQILNTVVDVGGTAVIGTIISGGDPAGGAALVGATNAYSSYVQGTEEEGLDPNTAVGKAAIEGLTLAAGVRIPVAFGPNVLKNTLVYGPGVNVGMGFIHRGTTHEWLKANGYKEQAEQYQWLDSKAMIIDAVLGSVFGYLGAKSHVLLNREIAPSDVDVALTGNKDYHMEIDVAPGIPIDGLSRQAHIDSVSKSIDDLLNDRPVDVTPILKDAEFIERRPSDQTPRQLKETLDSVGQGHVIDEMAPGKKVEDMTTDELRRELLRDPLTGIGNRRAFNEAEKLPVRGSIDADGLKWINDNLGHEAGDQMLRTIAKALAAETKQAFRMGGDEFMVQAKTIKQAEEMMQRAVKRLENAIISVKTPDGGTIEVKGVKLSYGIGKTSDEAEARLQSHKSEREQLGLRNSRGDKPSGITRTPPSGKQGDQGDAASHRGFPERVGDAVERLKRVLTGKPEESKSADKTAEESTQTKPPELTAAEQAMAARPDIEIQTEAGPVKASELMALADEEISKATKESIAFDAAINCFLRYGT